MANTTLTQFQAEINLYGFDATAYNSRITTWANEAVKEITRNLDLPEEEADISPTLVAGTNTYTLSPTPVRILYVVNDTSDYQLQPLEVTELESLDHTTRGQPTYYALKSNNILFLYPAPDIITYAIRVRVIASPTLMSAGGDTSGLNEVFDDAIKAYILSEAYAAEDDANMSVFWFGKYKTKLQARGEDQMAPDASGPRQVPGTWGGF